MSKPQSCGQCECCAAWRAERERDEALALLRKCRAYIRDERQPHPNSPVGQLLARLDVLLERQR